MIPSNISPFCGTISILLYVIVQVAEVTQSVSSGQSRSLERAELIALDGEVSEFYRSSYEDLDRRNVNFTHQLYLAIRAIRHTNVVHHNDFWYTSNETKWKSMGKRVDGELCRRQLAALTSILDASATTGLDLSLPLSVHDFLTTSGQMGAGVLNGNFFWAGSYASCVRARVPASTLNKVAITKDQQQQDINGRYCVAHLRAKSWPRWDKYFEDRITIKRGLCLPQSCHTTVYDSDEEIQKHVEQLAFNHLVEPFTREHFEVHSLYCLPDEDSPFRQLDTGGKLFIGFITFWLLLTVYVNIKYHQRLETMKQLNETVDIRMIINEKRDTDEDGAQQGRGNNAGTLGGDGDDYKTLELNLNDLLRSEMSGAEESSNELELRLEPKSPRIGARPPPSPMMGFHLSSGSSAAAAASTTPIPSDLDDDDYDDGGQECDMHKDAGEGSSEGVRRRRRRASNTSNGSKSPGRSANFDYDKSKQQQQKQRQTSVFDWIGALSIDKNLKFLFYRPRERTEQPVNYSHSSGARTTSGSRAGSRRTSKSLVARGRGSQSQLAAVARRSSSSNEALIKDLAPEQNAKVAIVKGNGEQQQVAMNGNNIDNDPDGMRGRRVNVEILDGFKVVATCWIIHGHTMMTFFGGATDLRFGVERMFDITMIVTINTLQIVGLFYIITGCLLTYFSFSKTKKKQLLKPTFWLLVLVGRYLRLMPTYALVFWFARHVAPLTGAGRDWYDYRTDAEHPRGYCAQESWWIMWTMSTADVKIPMDCIPQAWYLSNDFRTLLVLPIYVCLLAHNVIMGYSAIFATFVYATIKFVTILRGANIDYRVLLLWHPHVYSIMTDRLHGVYTDFSVRMATYLLGVVVGHLLYLYEIGQIRAWPTWFRRYGVKVTFGLGSLIFFGVVLLSHPMINQFLLTRDQVESDMAVWLVPLFKNSMEVCMCVIILLVVTGAGSKWLRRAMSSQTMKILSNISYAVFLTHVEIMYKTPIAQFESNYWVLFLYGCFFIVLSHMLSFFIYLLWEMPINNLTRHLFKRAFQAISD